MRTNIIIAMWSGPRNLSTALMRSFGNRNDVTQVLDEPFYASYLIKTSKNHPLKDKVIASQLNNIEDIKHQCKKNSIGITYQKHMTHHILDKDYSWMNTLKNCFLIRNPKMVVKSFMKSWNDGDFMDIGFSQQYEIYKYIYNNVDDTPPVLDASRIRNNPKKILTKYCDIIGIPWDENMLSWDPGLRKYDGVWATHWYSSVLKSTSFSPEHSKDLKLTDDEKRIVDKAMPIYNDLLKVAI